MIDSGKQYRVEIPDKIKQMIKQNITLDTTP